MVAAGEERGRGLGAARADGWQGPRRHPRPSRQEGRGGASPPPPLVADDASDVDRCRERAAPAPALGGEGRSRRRRRGAAILPRVVCGRWEDGGCRCWRRLVEGSRRDDALSAGRPGLAAAAALPATAESPPPAPEMEGGGSGRWRRCAERFRRFLVWEGVGGRREAAEAVDAGRGEAVVATPSLRVNLAAELVAALPRLPSSGCRCSRSRRPPRGGRPPLSGGSGFCGGRAVSSLLVGCPRAARSAPGPLLARCRSATAGWQYGRPLDPTHGRRRGEGWSVHGAALLAAGGAPSGGGSLRYLRLAVSGGGHRATASDAGRSVFVLQRETAAVQRQLRRGWEVEATSVGDTALKVSAAFVWTMGGGREVAAVAGDAGWGRRPLRASTLQRSLPLPSHGWPHPSVDPATAALV